MLVTITAWTLSSRAPSRQGSGPLQGELVRQIAVEGESAVDHAHMVKVRKYEQRCTAEGIHFLPVAVDTFGGWHPSALATLKKLGRQLARNVGREDAEVVRHLSQRLSILLVRDNVALLCARTPSFPSPDIDGDVD